MTKADLIDKISSGAGISKTAANNAVNITLDSIKSALKKGQTVSLIGFGTFSVGKRKARRGRNPRTGEEIKIPATKVPKFSPGKVLKDVVK
ncbi:MAG: HU family DNA-binding protein [Nitrospirae bacterium]|jgi:DNA-binding protein HU-beta|nr:HU family DNA-binding protein [Nitrospirota bacterium]